MTTLITGAAGFIGFHVARRLLERGERVLGIDNVNDYYSPKLKRDRVAKQQADFGEAFEFLEADFADHLGLDAVLAGRDFDGIVHLGAQAGVRYSIEQPRAYVQANLVGHLNMLEIARHRRSRHFVYAFVLFRLLAAMTACRSAWRTGSITAVALRRDQEGGRADERDLRPSLPAAADGLRFFTVYGPWGRPDMAMWLFTQAIFAARRSRCSARAICAATFTYIDDIVTGVVACLDNPPPDDGEIKAGGSKAPHRLYNIGNHNSEELTRMIG
jgi:UDP-glucuronate 4-epimerase